VARRPPGMGACDQLPCGAGDHQRIVRIREEAGQNAHAVRVARARAGAHRILVVVTAVVEAKYAGSRVGRRPLEPRLAALQHAGLEVVRLVIGLAAAAPTPAAAAPERGRAAATAAPAHGAAAPATAAAAQGGTPPTAAHGSDNLGVDQLFLVDEASSPASSEIPEQRQTGTYRSPTPETTPPNPEPRPAPREAGHVCRHPGRLALAAHPGKLAGASSRSGGSRRVILASGGAAERRAPKTCAPRTPRRNSDAETRVEWMQPLGRPGSAPRLPLGQVTPKRCGRNITEMPVAQSRPSGSPTRHTNGGMA